MSYIVQPTWPDDTEAMVQQIEDARWRLAWTVMSLRASIEAVRETQACAAQLRQWVPLRSNLDPSAAKAAS